MTRTLRLTALLLFVGATLVSQAASGQQAAAVWKAPSRASRKKNPLPDNADVIAQGKVVFETQCVSCHGTTGVGDGVAAKDLEKHPGDLTSAKVQAQSDGSMFWKVTTGRAPMTAFGTTLSVEQRWQVVRYVRTLIGGPELVAPELKAPEFLRASLTKLEQPYEALRRSLAKGDSQAAGAALPALTSAIGDLAKVDTVKLDGKLGTLWKQSVKAVADAAASMDAPSGLDELRASFGGLSAAAEAAWARFGHTLDSPLFVFECSKAGKTGALRWVQATREPENPYLESKEVSCVKLLRGMTATRPQAKGSGGSK